MPRLVALLTLLALAVLALPTHAAGARPPRGGDATIGANAVTAAYAAGTWTLRGTDARDTTAYKLDDGRFTVDHANLTGPFCDEAAVRHGEPCGAGLPVCRTNIGPHVVCSGVSVTLVRYDLGAGGDHISGRDRELPLHVVAGAGPDLIAGDHGDDRIEGGTGNDTLEDQRLDLPGPPSQDDDVLTGGPGNDELSSYGGRDRVDCGPGRDVAYVRPGTRTVGCEEVARAPAG